VTNDDESKPSAEPDPSERIDASQRADLGDPVTGSRDADEGTKGDSVVVDAFAADDSHGLADDEVDEVDEEPPVSTEPADTSRLRPGLRRLVSVSAVLAGLAVGAVVLPTLAPAPQPNTSQAPAPTASPTSTPADAPISGGLAPFGTSSMTALTTQALKEAAVQQVLDTRSRAVVLKQADPFLQTVAPGDEAFVAKQRMLATNLVALPFATWRYRIIEQLDSSNPVAGPQLRRAGSQAVAYSVEASYRLAGFGDQDTLSPRVMTFIPDGPTWKLVADVDIGAFREPWDVTPLRVVSGKGVLMVVSGDPVPVQAVLRQAELAVRQVTQIWGEDWDQRVLLVVPSTQDQLGTMLRRDGSSYTNLAAVATAELRGGQGAAPAHRVWVNPSGFQRITALGRLIVLRHEITHVATEAAIPSDFAIWLEEGFADYVGYRDADVRPQIVAADLLKDAQAGRIPKQLPTKADFRTSNKNLSQAYEGAWWAAQLIADRYGEDSLLRVYRVALAEKDEASAVDTALRQELGISTEELTKLWQDSIRAAAR